MSANAVSAANALRARGLRISAARRHVLNALYAAERPVTAEELAAGRSRASVYRNLAALEAAGLARHLHAGHGPGRWEASDREPRAYLACDGCGVVRPLAPQVAESIRLTVLAACGLEPQLAHFPIVGRCAACARSTR
jgi:Fur family ferric uptake transcriptional regulator